MGVRLRVPVDVPLLDADGEEVAEKEGVGVLLGEDVPVGVLDEVLLKVEEGELDELPVGVMDEVLLKVEEGEHDPVEVAEEPPLVLELGEEVCDRVDEALSDEVLLGEDVPVGLPDELPLELIETLPLGEDVPVPVAVAEELPDGLILGEDDGV